MANHKSAQKRIRQNEKKRIQNKMNLSSFRTVIKKLENTIQEGNKEEANKQFPKAQSALKKASNKGLFKANKVSRKVSRLAAAIKKLA